MELRIYLKMLQRGWWIIVLTALLALNVALTASYLATPQYQASARFVVSPNPALVASQDIVSSLEALDKRSIVSTYGEFLNSNRVFGETAQDLGLDQQTLEKAYTRSTVVLPDANILELTISGPNAELAANLANSIGKRTISYIEGIYQAYQITFLDPATVPLKPYSPNPVRDGGLAAVLGLILGAVLAITREQLLIPLETYRKRNMLDKVSNALSRKFFQHRLEQEIERHPSGMFSIGLLQLNGLNDLVDSLPQPLTQKLLTGVTDTLRKELRGNDLVGRWGDTSFMVMLPATAENAAARTLQRICNALSRPVQLDANAEKIDLDPRVSVTSYQGNETAQQFLLRAENAL